MIRSLDVYLHNIQAGILTQELTGQISFTYNKKYIEKSGAKPLSYSLPLRKEKFDFKECRGYFSGILPEGEIRNIIARNLGISSGNDFSLLEQIGGECAGALTFVPSGQSLNFSQFQYKQLSSTELYSLLKELPKRPLLAGEQGVRLSLAGAQNKLAVRVEGNKISIPLGSTPSTHILKPANNFFNGIVINETLCMKLAAIIGLSTSQVEFRRADDIEYLLVKRFDRSSIDNIPNQFMRMHQEDFCQALGIVSDKKYQKEGGPSLKDCFQLLREVTNIPLFNLQQFLDYVIYNYLISNCDAHGKNYSLLYDSNVNGETIIGLAPLYDLVCTEYYPELDKNLAMAIGDKYASSSIKASHFEKLALDAGLSKLFVIKRVKELGNLILENIHKVLMDHPVSMEVSNLIIVRIKHVLSSF